MKRFGKRDASQCVIIPEAANTNGWQAIRQWPVLVQYEEIEKRTAEHRQYLAQLENHDLVQKPNNTCINKATMWWNLQGIWAMPGVYRVDLITRLIEQPDPIHGQPTETLLSNKEMGESSGSYIIRLPVDVPMLFTAHSLGHATTNRYASIISNDPESDVTRFRHSVSFQVKAEELC
ncbi:hypothetical protein M0R45_009025 [Rubus argutus]|uniref:Uncharacterized protein n=1 Tax=Rubus argutus TaxID=59490 RepID=A0AAW1Y3S0_RUBAR